MKAEDFKPCALCGKGMMHTGVPLFYRVTVEHLGIKMREVAYWKHEFYRVEKMVESEQDRVEELERQLAAAKEAIEDAPHAGYCGVPSSSGAKVYECRCWKAEALSKLSVDKGGDSGN